MVYLHTQDISPKLYHIFIKMQKTIIQPSNFAKGVGFSLTTYMDSLDSVQQNKDLSRVWMLTGDPTAYGQAQIRMPSEGYEEVKKNIRQPNNHGYAISIGIQQARKSVIKHFGGGKEVDASDVIITSGVNMGLLYCLDAICNPGQNILVPETGYPFYDQLAPSRGIEVRKYRLLKEKTFEIDLEHLKSLADDKTKFVYIVNPSNPMGSVFSKQHLQDLLNVVNQIKAIIVADEVYHGMTFEKQDFYSIGHLTEEAPVIALCGLEKIFCVPGWCTSWMIIYDPKKHLKQVKVALYTITSLFIHTNVFLQKSLPALLDQLDGHGFTRKYMKIYQQNHDYVLNKSKEYKWLIPYPAKGTLYIVVEVDLKAFDNISSDVQLVKKLIAEQNVNLIPLSTMGNLCGLRVLTCCKKQLYDELFIRLERFYERNKAK